MAAKGGLGRGLNNKGLGIDALIGSRPVTKKKTESEKAESIETKTETVSNKKTDKTNMASTKKISETKKQEKVKEVVKEVIKEVKAEEYVNISLVYPNKNQPRKAFDEEALSELAESIKNYGIISPIIVKKNDDFYEIIAGERRWRAAKLAGLKQVPVIVREYDEQAAAEISIIENIQRENLNPIEEAKAYRRLMDDYSLKQDEIAEKVAKSRVFITNSLRLLKLDERVQRMLEDKLISAGHARAILAISDSDGQYEIAQKAFHNNLSVRDIEKLVRDYGKVQIKSEPESEAEGIKLAYEDMGLKLSEALGTKVSINRKKDNKGRVEIYYSSIEQLEELMSQIINNKNNK